MKRAILAVMILVCATAAFAQKAPADKRTIETDIPSLAQVWKDRFVIGTCVDPGQLSGPEAALLLKHFTGITAENAMKPAIMSVAEGTYNFAAADKIVNFAVRNKLKIRGHTLVWHEQFAPWMFVDRQGKKVSKEVLLKRLKDYITAVVGRYKGKVYAWDVVNEVVDRKGLRNSDWYRICGEDYIEAAFRYAREADPGAKLFINEIESTDREKEAGLYQLVKSLQEKKVPVDGIGMQFHISLFNPSLERMELSIKKYDELGLELHVTELDMSVNGDPNMPSDAAPADFLIRQAHRYREVFEIFGKFKSVTNVTFWGYNDGHTWLTFVPVKKPDWPLLFDRDLKAKPAYWGLVEPARLPKDVVVSANRNFNSASAVKGTPVLDGVMDEVWKRSPELPITIFVQGTGATGSGRVLWDEGNLYVFVQVKDPVLSKKNPNSYEQDSIEIFVDEKNNKSPEYLADDAQYRINFANDFSSRGYPAQITSVTAVTADGYQIEVKIPLQSVQGRPGLKIGFDLQINDDPGSGRRETIAKWNDPTNESFRNTAGFGTLILK